MTTYKTWGDLRQEIERECDIEGEDFISPEELIDAANEAIKACEKMVLGINEDYFLDSTPLTFVNGTPSYDLPAGIFAHKIRDIVYTNGSVVYEIKRIRQWKKFLEYAINKVSGAGTSWPYKYFVKNSVAGSPKVIISPTPTEAGALAEVWFIREANRVVDDTSVLDIPEAETFIKLYCKEKVYFKEGNPMFAATVALREDAGKELVDALTAMAPDDDNEVEADFSFYNEHN